MLARGKRERTKYISGWKRRKERRQGKERKNTRKKERKKRGMSRCEEDMTREKV